MNQPQQTQIINVAPIQISGPTAEFHIVRHKAKLMKNPGDCGIDIFPSGITRIEESDCAIFHQIYVSTGVHMLCCMGIFLFITARSSTAKRVPGALALTGVIDSGYTGEILLRFQCTKSMSEDIGRRILVCVQEKIALAQAIPILHAFPQFIYIQGGLIIPPGGRGVNGFGSTDKS